MDGDQWTTEDNREKALRKRFYGKATVSAKSPPCGAANSGKIEPSPINHKFVLTRMIFATVILFTYTLLDSVVNCASLEHGSQISPIKSLSSSNYAATSNIRSPNFRGNSSKPVSDNVSSRSFGPNRQSQSRQVSTSEWIFSSLLQPHEDQRSPSALNGRQTHHQTKRENSMLTYRSLPPYTNYYRNPNIYAEKSLRMETNLDRAYYSPSSQYNGIYFGEQVQTESGNARRTPPASDNLHFDKTRQSESSGTLVNADKRADITKLSTTPGVEMGTTGVSRTAPATDSSVMATERVTSTQEMQILNEDAYSHNDDLQFDTRDDIGKALSGRKHGGNKNGRETISFSREDDTIIFPGAPAAVTTKGNSRSHSQVDGVGSDPLGIGNFNPFEKKILDGWKRLHTMRSLSISSVGLKNNAPNDHSTDSKIRTILNIDGVPKCAKTIGDFCTDIDTYPKALLNQVLIKSLSPEIFRGIFGETIDNETAIIPDDIQGRIDLREDENLEPLCSVRPHIIYPKAAQNRKGKYMYIVNHDEYLQGIRVEMCRENGPCMFTEGHLPGYTSTCRQKYIYKKLLALTPEGKAMPDTFRLPSCCVCYMRGIHVSDRHNQEGISDGQPTSSTVEGATIVHPNHDDASAGSSSTASSTVSISSSTESGVEVTLLTTSKYDLPTFQVPSPTTSTSSPQSSTEPHIEGPLFHNFTAVNLTSSRRIH